MEGLAFGSPLASVNLHRAEGTKSPPCLGVPLRMGALLFHLIAMFEGEGWFKHGSSQL